MSINLYQLRANFLMEVGGFFGSIAMQLDLIDSKSVDYACVTGSGSFEINTEWLLTEDRISDNFLFFHEICHVVLDHIGRSNGRDKVIWNNACDHVINLKAIEEGFIPYDWVLKDPKFIGLNADEVYEILIAEEVEPNNKWVDTENTVESNVEVLKQIITSNVLAFTKDASKVLGEDVVAEIIKSTKPPKLNWREYLNQSLFKDIEPEYKGEFDVVQHSCGGIIDILPEYTGYGDAVIALDFSYSMRSVYTTLVTEVYLMVQELEPNNITLLLFDTEVQSELKVTSLSDLLNWKLVGGGGTNIQCVVDHLRKRKLDTLIIISDFEDKVVMEDTSDRYTTINLQVGDYPYRSPFIENIKIPRLLSDL